jgi:hypothetical protein
VQPDSNDYLAEIAHHVTARDRCVIDIAPRLGCACSGAVAGEPWASARATVTELEPERAVHEVLDHDMIVDVSGSVETWTGSASGGVPTLPTTLAVLAGLYDPDRKAPSIRRAPASPVPFPIATRPARRSGREPAFPTAPLPNPRAPEPLTGGPPRASEPFGGRSLRPPAPWAAGAARRPEPVTGGPPRPATPGAGRVKREGEPITGAPAYDPFTAMPAFIATPHSPYTPTPPAPMLVIPEAATPEPAATGASARPTEPVTPVRDAESRSIEPITAATFAALRPNQTSPGPITAAGLEIVAVPDGWDGQDRRRWDGVERRKAWSGARPTEPTTHPLPIEPRTGPIRQTQGFMRGPATAADRRRILGLAVACSAIVASATSVITVQMLWHGRVAATAPVPHPKVDSAHAPAAPAPAPAPQPDSTVTPVDTPPPATQAPVVTPSPTVAAAPPPTPRRPIHAHRVPTPVRGAFGPTSTPGTLVAPGAAPIPRASDAAAAPAPKVPDSPDLLQIRAEIAARKHRIDSLAQLVDSLRITSHVTAPRTPVTVPTP